MMPLLQADQGEALRRLIDRLPGCSVAVIGDAMLDRMIFGTVERISPEAPIPILRVSREIGTPGGAGNAVRNLTALGVAAAFVSVVGDDQAGADLTSLVGGQPNVEPWLLVEAGRTTTRKSRFLSKNQQVMRVDREQTDPIESRLAERLLRIARDVIAATDVTLISDYGKGVLTEEVTPHLVAAARQMGKPVIVDPCGEDYAPYAGADLLVANRSELARASRMPTGSPASLGEAAQALRRMHGFTAVLVTQGDGGMTMVEDAAHHMPALTADLVDSSGVGDTVAAVAAAALAAKAGLAEAMRLANVAASIVIGRAGTAVARPDDLRRSLDACTASGG